MIQGAFWCGKQEYHSTVLEPKYFELRYRYVASDARGYMLGLRGQCTAIGWRGDVVRTCLGRSTFFPPLLLPKLHYNTMEREQELPFSVMKPDALSCLDADIVLESEW